MIPKHRARLMAPLPSRERSWPRHVSARVLQSRDTSRGRDSIRISPLGAPSGQTKGAVANRPFQLLEIFGGLDGT